MKKNLGMLDRIFRFVLGLVWLSPFAPRFDFFLLNWLVTIIAIIALVESFIGWCWLHDLFRINNKEQ